ncbi:glucose-6-phosphate isomerase [Campylobacter sp. RM16192]|uniref:glucose-6-phosphate isomerase n=1 Tax=Campylobacter sp. RM16192 TaxID=1660080 RepID=UPI001451D622|nr:glucose-6-phosphate isomerase [Campylobacter sp. RM16192]QCD52177.1 phosphoglucose isomerase [Campylobacter sp. RM16192]
MVKNNLFFEKTPISAIKSYAKRMNEELESGDIGYYHLPELGGDILASISKFEDNFKDIKNIVLVGIGGSSLGVKALKCLLESRKKPDSKDLYFLDNVDPFSFEKMFDKLKFNDTLFIISSKSGTTIETITLFKCILDRFKPRNLNKNFLIITDPGSPLETYAKENNIVFFNIPKNVGGRFSVLSAIGLVPLTLCGYDTKALLDGAIECKKQFLQENDNTLMYKAYHYATHKNAKINVIFSYSDRFLEFNDWYVQLWAESLGKKEGFKRYGLTPVGLIGSRDQHSFLQLIMDGTKDKTVTFIKILDHDSTTTTPNLNLSHLEECNFVNHLKLSDLINAQCDATTHALMQEGISVDLISIDRLDEWHAGYLIYYYELLTSATGIMLGINTYDQPGVEVGKRILKTMLQK